MDATSLTLPLPAPGREDWNKAVTIVQLVYI